MLFGIELKTIAFVAIGSALIIGYVHKSWSGSESPGRNKNDGSGRRKRKGTANSISQRKHSRTKDSSKTDNKKSKKSKLFSREKSDKEEIKEDETE